MRSFKNLLPERYAKYIIKEMDANGDGCIDFEEFWEVFGSIEKKGKSDIDSLCRAFRFLSGN